MRWCLCCLVMIFPVSLSAQDPPRYSVVIHEIFADPTPSRGLPGSEFIELRNRSSMDINLRNWSVRSGGSTARISSSFILKPDSIVVISSSGAVANFLRYGAAIAASPFPALDNDGDTLVLISPSGAVIHALAYSKDWYDNDIKAEGGWSLEMKDISKPCVEKPNWGASVATPGGTPGQPNSISSPITDTSAPYPLYAYMENSQTIHLLISEPLDQAPLISVKDLPHEAPTLSSPFFNTVTIKLKEPIKDEQISTVFIEKIKDCSGNPGKRDSVPFGKFTAAINSQLAINEVLFDPPVGGWDYVEIFNRSSQVVDLGAVSLANRNSSGKVSSLSKLSSIPYPILPYTYAVVCEDTGWISKYYSPGKVKMIASTLPSYPDDEGHVVLANEAGTVIDELAYSSKWHHALVSEPKGIALERLMISRNTQDPRNWHSASGSSGFGTPGYRNSQFVDTVSGSSKVLQLSSRIVSPDLDGRDDVLVMNYRLDQPGYIANITVFDQKGSLVKRIAENQLCGTSGYFRWDGSGDGRQKLSRGSYLVNAEFFALSGKRIREKHSIGIW